MNNVVRFKKESKEIKQMAEEREKTRLRMDHYRRKVERVDDATPPSKKNNE